LGWFDDQIKQRAGADQTRLNEAFANMSSVIMGSSVLSAYRADDKLANNAISQVLAYYHVEMDEQSESFPDLDAKLDDCLQLSGLMRRGIKLNAGWYKDAIGALLGKTADGELVALIPKKLGVYSYLDSKTGRRVRVTKRTAVNLCEDALCFYSPFPQKELKVSDLLLFIARSLTSGELVMVAGITLLVTLTGMLFPYINRIVFGAVVPGGQTGLILPIALFLLGVTLSRTLFGIADALIQSRVKTRINLSVQSATMLRVLSLPASFFKQFAAGDIAARVDYINGLCDTLQNAVMNVGFTTLFSLIYFTQIFTYSPGLAIPALLVILLSSAITLLTAAVGQKLSAKSMRLGARQNGLQYALLSGIQKIRLAGAENRAFAKWANGYADIARLQYDPPAFLKYSVVLSSAANMAGIIAIYYSAAASGVGVAGYMAFSVSYGMVSSAFASLFGIVATLANIGPALEMAKPLLKSVPETGKGKKAARSTNASLELDNITFRYSEGMPLLFDGLSLKIKSGQYIAIVGKTGCGKSTLVRLMLGFETPQKGAVYFGSQDISKLDKKSLRRNFGVVLQNSKLMQGNIFSNITVSAPWLTLKDAWEAAEFAGIADDIRAMPMGMHTMITEGSGGISGGQRQRLMIARAIASKPKILIFDEATSALDNITQQRISASLSKLKCTRIVLAHRLSTIRQCDRIIVLENGKIIEDGSYEELLKIGGYFRELIERQRLDICGPSES
jgi:NHLM bacteriocin system ABC transporter ATP-binding protein